MTAGQRAGRLDPPGTPRDSDWDSSTDESGAASRLGSGKRREPPFAVRSPGGGNKPGEMSTRVASSSETLSGPTAANGRAAAWLGMLAAAANAEANAVQDSNRLTGSFSKARSRTRSTSVEICGSLTLGRSGSSWTSL